MAMSDIEYERYKEEIIDRNDIVEVISMYAKLKRSGRTYRGLCPIHNDRKNPSLSVDPQNRLFKCFGCGAGGTVIQFIMSMEHLAFKDALSFLANRAGIQPPQALTPDEARREAAKRDKMSMLFDIHKEAAKYFYRCLCDKKNTVALEYLRKRNISNETIKKFGIGYAPQSSGLGNYLKTKGFSLSEAAEAVLIYNDKDGHFDKFRGRIMFPVFDLNGNVIAFGGRTIFDDKAKYMNSNGSLIYNKSKNLFAFNFAKDTKKDEFLLMEGNVDVISLHQAGFDNATASLGTAFTPEQARLIKRYKDRVILCYDSDEAGVKAVHAAGKILMDEGISVKVLTVTGAKDPDEYINKYGPEMFQGLIDKAENFIEYKIRKTAEKYNFDDIEQKIAFIGEAAQIFAEIKDPMKMEIYVNDIAKKVDISPQKFMAQIQNLRKTDKGKEERTALREEMRNIETRRGGRERTPKERQLYDAEKLFLNLICDKKVYDRVKDEVSPEDMTEKLHKKMCEKLYALHEEGCKFEATRFVSEFESEEIGDVSEILTDDKNVESREEAITLPLEIIKENMQSKKIESLDKNDDEGLMEYFRQLSSKKQ
ncbi:MAG: DNA primase [Clostridia bacterium]|nr:DNA primase [Clostridia bacterium]